MKQLLLVLLVSFPTIMPSAALAWSPLDGLESAVETMRHCYFTAASDEQDQQGQEDEGEEEDEPDCD